MTPIVLFPNTDIQPPFKSLGDLRYFVENKTIPRVPVPSKGEISFTAELPRGSSTMKVRFVNANQTHKFSTRDWMSVIGVFATGYKSFLDSFPMASFDDLGKCFKVFYTQWDDDVPLPSFLETFPINVMRFSQGSRHNDRIHWLDMVHQFVTRLDSPYGFDELRQILSANQKNDGI
eukprot:Protomagalhaensia_sp_Gyna_25__4826@NODE_496_length_3265_cov_96_813391_g387_i0_p3_GENE_NODE_496_length_3265_cov_96_813391_g387_i0NODE_496_length_3265_cov_96_813391_g387_i0_p3_ORF_typecomplete_len176_score25_10CDC73_C/PF05179_14/1_2e12_NODE_496_length_3265_cov_96_813391_g387_i015182045